MKKRGLFITFEGGEGAGKTTQIKKLAAALGDDCIVTREPGGTPEAEAMRALFMTNKGQDWPLETQALFMFAARSHHTKTLIQPLLSQGKTVICDRYYDSTMVYQGYAGGMDIESLLNIQKAAIGDLAPDLTFVLDLPPQIGLTRAKRIQDSNASFETKTIDFHEKIRQGFLKIAKDNPKRCVVVNAELPMEEILNIILNTVKNYV